MKVLSVVKQVGLVVCLSLAVAAKAQVNLGAAGPQNYAVLEIGDNGNVSIANASNAGFIDGNVGIANGSSLGDSGTPINGNVVTYANPSGNPPLNPNVAGNTSGTITQNSAAITAAVNAANAAALAALSMTASSGITSITSGGMLTPGVYDLTTLNLNSAVLNLEAGGVGYYVFNISGGLTLNSSQILAAPGLSDANILFNVNGNVSFSGGLSQESILDGVILDTNKNSQISIGPGLVNGEVIGAQNISISSGGAVNDTISSVPEPSTILSGALLLLPLGIGTLRALRQRHAE